MAINTAGQIITGNTSPADPPAFKTGVINYDATAIVAADYTVVTIGFTPKYICWENVTDRVKLEWYEGMAANSCIKTAATGTRTLEITSGNGGITVCDSAGVATTLGRSFEVLQNATLAAVLASKVCTWFVRG